jgi:hypothetical protein
MTGLIFASLPLWCGVVLIIMLARKRPMSRMHRFAALFLLPLFLLPLVSMGKSQGGLAFGAITALASVPIIAIGSVLFWMAEADNDGRQISDYLISGAITAVTLTSVILLQR